MAKRQTVAALAVAVILSILSGCGTLANNARPGTIFDPGNGKNCERVYGGTRLDLEWGAQTLWTIVRGESQNPAGEFVFGAAGLSIDLPLSALGDTLFLPWNVWTEVDRAIADLPFPSKSAPVLPRKPPVEEE